jgi:hypothetical protein
MYCGSHEADSNRLASWIQRISLLLLMGDSGIQELYSISKNLRIITMGYFLGFSVFRISW